MYLRSELKMTELKGSDDLKNSFQGAKWLRVDPFLWFDHKPFPDLFEWISRSLRARMNDTQKENRV